MEYSQEQLMTALRAADTAGDTDGAKRIAQMVNKGSFGAPTPEKLAYEADDGGLIFNKLDQNEQYMQDLKDDYKDREGTEFEGDANELKEENFEYWNSTLLNELSMGDTVYDISQMDDKQKTRTLRMFQTYDKTNMTGEGSRAGWEQFKDAGSLLWAPTTWVGGKFIAGGAQHLAGRTGIQKLLSGVGARSGAVGGGITGAQDIAQQTGVEMQLDEDQEFDVGRAATATALGGALGAAAPAAIKGVGRVLQGAGKTVKAITSPIETAKAVKGGAVKAMGGGEAAREGVAREVKENLTKNLGDEGKEEAAESLGQSLKSVIKSGRELFTTRYDELGEVDVTMDEVSNLVSRLHSKSGMNRIGNLDDTIDAMIGGELTPTQALRKVRSTLGKESDRARRGVGSNISSDQVLSKFYNTSRKMFSNAASKAGKGKQALELDKDYSKFLGIRGDRTVVNAQKDHSAATRKLNQAISSKDPHKVQEFIDQMYELGSLSGDVNFGDLQKQNLQKALHEHLFTGQSSAPLKRFLGDKSGVKVLQKVFGDIMDDKAWQGYADILENAHDYKGMGILMSRIAATAAGGMTGGPLGMIAGLTGLNVLMKSKPFQGAAMKVFSNNANAKKKGLGMIAKIMESKGMDAATRKQVTEMLVGATVAGAGLYSARDTDPEEVAKEASSKLKAGYSDLSQYFK